MRLIILSPEKTVIDRDVTAVELPGTKGRFVVLKGHAPLMTTLEEGYVGYDSEETESRTKIRIGGGFAMIREEVVTICVE